MFLKMFALLPILGFLITFFAVNGEKAQQCTVEKCKIDNNCRCSSPTCPIDKTTVPQLVALTFDDAVTEEIFEKYWATLLLNRANPDGVPIGATFFVPHEYTDYQRVNDLYNYGFEIGVNSITKNSNQDYWRLATSETLEQEFGGQRTIISKFANIPAADIKGVRTPQLQLAGNNSIKAFVNCQFVYDSSWPTRSTKPLFPYTLDYFSSQECVLGSDCPNEEFKGFWESPIIDLNGEDGEQCSTLAGCNLTDTSPSTDQITNWLYNEVIKVRSESRAPLTLIVESQWFERYDNAYQAFGNVMDKLLELKDVFFVSQGQLIEWTKNPVPVSQFVTEYDNTRAAGCTRASVCKLTNTANQPRNMPSCVACPTNYPWLGNPLGS